MNLHLNGDVPFKKINFDFPCAEFKNEIESLNPYFRDFTSERKIKKLFSLPIFGVESYLDHPSQSDGYDISKINKDKFCELKEFFPIIYKYFAKEFPFLGYNRILCLRQKPGGWMHFHSHGYHEDVIQVVFSIDYNPQSCFLFETGHKIPFVGGDMFQVKQWLKHATFNAGNSDRILILVEGIPDQQKWKSLLETPS